MNDRSALGRAFIALNQIPCSARPTTHCVTKSFLSACTHARAHTHTHIHTHPRSHPHEHVHSVQERRRGGGGGGGSQGGGGGDGVGRGRVERAQEEEEAQEEGACVRGFGWVGMRKGILSITGTCAVYLTALNPPFPLSKPHQTAQAPQEGPVGVMGVLCLGAVQPARMQGREGREGREESTAPRDSALY
jgi:hypothetical protein